MHWSFMIGWIISSHMEMVQRKFLFFLVVGDDVTWFLNEYFRVVRTIRFHPPRYAHHFLIIPRFIGLQLPDIFQLKIQMLQKWLPQNHSQLPTQQVVHFSLWSFPFWAAWLCIVGVLFSRNKTCEGITPIVSLVRFVILEVASLLFSRKSRRVKQNQIHQVIHETPLRNGALCTFGGSRRLRRPPNHGRTSRIGGGHGVEHVEYLEGLWGKEW